MPEPEYPVRYVAYPRGPQVTRDEGAFALRRLGEGYFSLSLTRLPVMFQIFVIGVEKYGGSNPSLIVGHVLAVIFSFILTVGSIGRIGRFLNWSWGASVGISLVYALVPTLVSPIPGKFGFGIVIPLAAVGFEIWATRLVNAELARYRIRLRGWIRGRVKENFREDVYAYEAGNPPPEIPLSAIADDIEVG